MERGKPVKTIILRGLALVSLLTAAIVMFVSCQKVDEESLKLLIRYTYTDWNGFMFCAIVDCIGCFYNLVVLMIPPGSQLWKTVVVLDVVTASIDGLDSPILDELFAKLNIDDLDTSMGHFSINLFFPLMKYVEIVNILVGTSLGAGWQTYLLMSKGNVQARWRPICGIAPYFCSKILGSLITSTFGFAIAIALHMCALHVSVDPFLVANQSL